MKKSKGISNQMDMLNGSIFDKILLFALPLAISSILQQLFNSVDVAVVGRFASSEALAAVGSNSSVISLLINLFVGISVGANVVIANYIGQGKTEKLDEAADIKAFSFFPPPWDWHTAAAPGQSMHCTHLPLPGSSARRCRQRDLCRSVATPQKRRPAG